MTWYLAAEVLNADFGVRGGAPGTSGDMPRSDIRADGPCGSHLGARLRAAVE
jgi:hypothetical protein